MRLHGCAAGKPRNLVDRIGRGGCDVPRVASCVRMKFFKKLHRSDHRAVLIVNGKGSNSHRNFVSALVMNKSACMGGVRRFQSVCGRAMLATELAARLVAVQEWFRDAGMAEHFMPQVPRHTLRAGAPQENSVLPVEDTDPSRQTLQNIAAHLGVIERSHVGGADHPLYQFPSAEIRKTSLRLMIRNRGRLAFQRGGSGPGNGQRA
jgi:hypothetical protein